jgi:hypothetical protein
LTPELEIVFDTLEKSRKFANISRDPRVAFVIGCQREVTVQYEGVVRQIFLLPSSGLTTKSIFGNLQTGRVA